MGILKRLRDKVEEIRWEDAADPSRWVQFVRSQVRLCFYILRELVRNHCPQQAAALTFTTLLSLVPLFAVAFSFFRGFEALQGMQRRAQEAVFRSILATPLLEGGRQAGPEEEPSGDEAAALSRMPAPALLAEADGRRRDARVTATLRLYVGALTGGADAAAVRAGMSTLHLGAAGSVEEPLALLRGAPLQAYLAAAGAQEAALAQPVAPEGAPEAYRAGRDGLHREDYRAALKAFGEAERLGYAPGLTRAGMAGAEEGLAADAAQVAPADALPHYRAALAYYLDAAVLCVATAEEAEVEGLARAQTEAVRALGGVLLEVGRQQSQDRQAARARGDAPAAAAALQEAIRSLTEAARLLGPSREVHGLLANELWAAGRFEDARREYEVALSAVNAAAARGISLAVVDYIRMFVDKVGRAEIGVIGIVFLLVTATSLLSTIEKTLNQIWKVTERRPFWIKFASFCTLIWLGPALIGASVWVHEGLARYLQSVLADAGPLRQVMGAAAQVSRYVLPPVVTWLVLLVLYIFLPHTRVRFRSAAWGALVAAVLFQGARPLFSLYVTGAVRYERIYGSLGAIPVFLLWIWLLWLIVLFGAEVSFTVQNVNLLRYRDKLHELSNIFIDRYLAARMMMYVARGFWETGQPVSSARLAQTLQITPEEAADGAGRLVRLGLLTPVGEERDEFHPARDLSRLKLSEVLSITDRFRDESRSSLPEDRPYEEKLEAAFRSAIAGQQEALSDMTFRDLLLQVDRQRTKGLPGDGRGGEVTPGPSGQVLDG